MPLHTSLGDRAPKESKQLTAADADVESLVKELLDSHTIG